MINPNATDEDIQGWNIVVLQDAVNKVISKPLTDEQAKKVREIAFNLFWTTIKENK